MQLANIENLFKNAVLLEQTDDLKNNDNNVKIYRFASPFVIDNQIADVLLTVKRSIDNDAKRIYSLELIEIKKLSEKGSTTTNAQYYTDSILRLQQKHEKIKSFLENNENKSRFGVGKEGFRVYFMHKKMRNQYLMLKGSNSPTDTHLIPLIII